MGMKPAEVVALAPEAMALSDDLAQAFGKDSDGGRRLTGRELRKLGKGLLSLGWKIIRDVLD